MFQTSRYQAPNMDFFDTDDKVRFYTGLPSMEVREVVFEQSLRRKPKEPKRKQPKLEEPKRKISAQENVLRLAKKWK